MRRPVAGADALAVTFYGRDRIGVCAGLAERRLSGDRR